MFEFRARLAVFDAHDGARSLGNDSPQIRFLHPFTAGNSSPVGTIPIARILSAMLLLLCCNPATIVRADDDDEHGEKPQVLFRASDFPKGWVYYSAEPNMKVSDNWRVQAGEKEVDDVLICTGHPFGYLKTEAPFEDFELNLEWSYPQDPNCNSGILIGTSGDDKIWPTSIQVQLHRPSAGSIFPIGGAKVDKIVRVRSGELKLEEWHKCVVRCEGERMTVSVNDAEVGKVTGCKPQKGCIALQSEGAEIHFRRIQVKKIK